MATFTLPNQGDEPWDLNPAINAINDEVEQTTDLVTTGRLSASSLASSFATAAQGTKADEALPAAQKGAASGVGTLDASGKQPESQIVTRLGNAQIVATVDALTPAKGTAPALSTRANLGIPHTLPPISSLTPPWAGSIPRVNINTVTGTGISTSWPVLADNTGAARWSGPVRVDTQTIASVPGCVIMQDLRSPATQGTAGIKWEFDTDAPDFALYGVWGANPVLIYRDGELITEGAISVGNPYLRILSYEYSGFHRYEVFGGPGMGLASIITRANDTVRKPLERRPVVGFMTDSYGTVYTPITGTTHIGLVGTICRILDWRPRVSIEGGSGYLTDGAGAANSKFSDRLSGFNGLNLDAMVFIGGRNDPTAGLQTAATGIIQTFQSANPGVPVIVGGPWAPSASWESGSQSGNFAALEAAASATGSIYVDTHGIITGDGDITANPGVAGNGSRMIAGAHPTPPSATDANYIADGRQYHGYEFARRIANKIGGY